MPIRATQSNSQQRLPDRIDSVHDHAHDPGHPIERLPVFSRLTPELRQGMRSVSRRIHVPARAIMQLAGTRCEYLVTVIHGGTRVYQNSPSGKEITVTEVRDGEVCVLSALSVLINRPYPANSVTLVDTDLLLIPAEWCRKCAGQSPELREFLLGFISDGVDQLLELIDDLAFKRMDERLSSYLVEKSDHGAVATTHQVIASDLGTAREVISRILGDFERRGLVSLGRSRIEILQPL